MLSGPVAPSREAAYAGAGRAVLDRCDVLIALWDGLPARGLGGTAELVVEARARALPLLWISTDPPYALREERLDRMAPPTAHNLEPLVEAAVKVKNGHRDEPWGP